jgi:hypothetical protein
MSDDKPAILQDSEFTVEEGILYRVCRTSAIWLNKVFFSALFLWFIWMLLGMAGLVEPGCADSYNVVETSNGTSDEPAEKCGVFLSTTSMYLFGMAIVSFLISIGLGLFGLVVGKNIIAMTPVKEEVGYTPEDNDAEADSEEA